MSHPRIEQLTFPRFLAVLIVLFFHGVGGVYFQVLNIYPFSVLLRGAAAAVTFLYSLSGFVMALAHYRPQEKFSFSEYWKARWLRLYPLYLLTFLLAAAYYADSLARIKLPKILSNVFAIQAWIPAYSQSFNYPAWSVTVEFFFYLIFPLFAFWAARRSSRFLLWASILFWAFTQTGLYILWQARIPESDRLLTYFPLFHLSSFLLGASAGVWYLREGGRKAQPVGRSGAALFLSIFLSSLYLIRAPQVPSLLSGDALMTGLLAPFLTLAILALALDASPLRAALYQPALILLGEISYALYLFHIPFKWWLARILAQQDAAQWMDFIYLPLVILLAWALHRWIDQPLRRWLKPLLARADLRLVLLDLLLFPAALYLVFFLRFPVPRELASYEGMMKLLFWTALLLQPSVFALLGAFDLSAPRVFRRALLAASAVFLLQAALSYLGYRLGWFENFPRSAFLFLGLLTLGVTLPSRWLLQKQAQSAARFNVK